MLRTPDGHSRIDLATFVSPPSPDGDLGAPANTPGIRHVTFAVTDIDAVVARLQARGAELVGDLERYQDSLLRPRPRGIIVELAERIG